MDTERSPESSKVTNIQMIGELVIEKGHSPGELLAELWLRLYKKRPILTAVGTVVC